MGFELAVVGGLLAVFLVFYAIGKYSTSTPEQFLDWKPTRSIETEIELELDDVRQMIEAQNERRRRDGRPLIDEDAFRNQVEMATREQREEAERARRERDEERERLGEKEWRKREAARERQLQRWADKERRGF
jgi:hypothetical protein